jgi:hypothetical protein
VAARQHAQREEEAQRARILVAKQQREDTLLSKAANIQRIRQVAAQHAQARRNDAAALKAGAGWFAARVRSCKALAAACTGTVP